MIIYVDIDGTICKTNGVDYGSSTPIPEAIERINKYYDEGHTIVYWTARGTISGNSFFTITLRQFEKWGVKFHELKFGKPAYDLLIDDRAQNSDVLLND